MHKITCIAIDDEPLALEVIKKYAYKNEKLLLQQVFTNVLEAEEYLQQHPIDLVFVDISMPDKNGIDFVNTLQQKPFIIFTTAHKQYALQAFDLSAVDYLLKPISPERFEKAIEKVSHQYTLTDKALTEECIYVYEEYKLIKINTEAIVYIESLQDYVKIHLSNANSVMTLQTLKKTIESLSTQKFIQIHRSYIIAVAKIKSVQQKNIQLQNDIVLPVGSSYAQQIKSFKEKLRN